MMKPSVINIRNETRSSADSYGAVRYRSLDPQVGPDFGEEGRRRKRQKEKEQEQEKKEKREEESRSLSRSERLSVSPRDLHRRQEPILLSLFLAPSPFLFLLCALATPRDPIRDRRHHQANPVDAARMILIEDTASQ